ncbi:MAG: hypothetical protein GX117_04075 [Candidatus Hydrogenedentes bacterium]|jgi:hypothetical protein|nr:hypothetical protein [Candidatus Hydrogenedentota bacterium]
MAVVKNRNNVVLHTKVDGVLYGNFKLREFENAEGLAMVHPTLLEGLERTRRDLGAYYGKTVYVIITSAVRTEQDNERLAKQLGWTEDGGLVSRGSYHLNRFGGIAVDLIAKEAETGRVVAQKTVGKICRRYFDWVKDDYADGHVHVDNRFRGQQ